MSAHMKVSGLDTLYTTYDLDTVIDKIDFNVAGNKLLRAKIITVDQCLLFVKYGEGYKLEELMPWVPMDEKIAMLQQFVVEMAKELQIVDETLLTRGPEELTVYKDRMLEILDKWSKLYDYGYTPN